MLRLVTENEQPHSSNSLEDTAHYLSVLVASN